MPLFAVVPAISGDAQRLDKPAGFEIVRVGNDCWNRKSAKPEETTNDRASNPRIPRVVSFFILNFIFLIYLLWIGFGKLGRSQITH